MTAFDGLGYALLVVSLDTLPQTGTFVDLADVQAVVAGILASGAVTVASIYYWRQLHKSTAWRWNAGLLLLGYGCGSALITGVAYWLDGLARHRLSVVSFSVVSVIIGGWLLYSQRRKWHEESTNVR